MRALKIFIAILLIISNTPYANSQGTFNEDLELLIQKKYEYLSKSFLTSKKDTYKAKTYARAYLLKAKKASDIVKEAEGYFMLASTSKAKEAILFTDSIIAIFKNKKDFNYPAKAHILKANFLGSQANYKEALNQLITANKLANSNKNIEQQYQIKYFIALLKNNLGEFEDSLLLLKNVVSYYNNKYSNNLIADYESSFTRNKSYKSGLITALYAYGNQLNILKNYNKAQEINAKAIILSLKSKDSLLYNRLLFSSAITHFYKKEYQASLDSIRKKGRIYKSKESGIGTVIRTNMYLGKIYTNQTKTKLAIDHLIKVDSLAFTHNYFFPSIRDNYELLIKHYKEKKDTDMQLFYINRLLEIDRILDNDILYVSHKMNEEYSKPNLILEKQRIIKSLQRNNSTKKVLLISLSLLSFLLVTLLIKNHKRQKLYKKRFQELFDNKILQKKVQPQQSKRKSLIDKKEIKEIDIPETIVNDILQQLQKFEENNGFLDANLSVTSLSKKIKTNSKYFSKVINRYKNKSFSNYINELRINYVLEELKTNSKFRKYTIKAIAKEIGFNTAEAFSKSFYKKTGIYPSFFIKEIDKKQT